MTRTCVEGAPQDFEGLRTLLVSRREMIAEAAEAARGLRARTGRRRWPSAPSPRSPSMPASSPRLSCASRKPSAMAAFRNCSRFSGPGCASAFRIIASAWRCCAARRIDSQVARRCSTASSSAASRVARAHARIRRPAGTLPAPSTSSPRRTRSTFSAPGACFRSRPISPTPSASSASAQASSTMSRSSDRSSSRRRRRATRCSRSASRPTPRSRSSSPLRGAARRAGRRDHRFGLQSARLRARMSGSKSRRRITALSAPSRPPSLSP